MIEINKKQETNLLKRDWFLVFYLFNLEKNFGGFLAE